ncbi:MAG: phosphoribosylformylglycinamidine synthase subunit PurQ [Candidatus Hydrogenedentes bacterium]|nr:phosphoribosylformylglycinamidine synthase subunit PurQ [Candidatus Hydrogenedentota bacterium]
MSKQVRTLVLTGFGINCDNETADAFERAGASADRVHLNDIIADPRCLQEYNILAVPGGFSFGDDIASGKILANRLRYRLGGPLSSFVSDGKPLIGICNGFQVLAKMGMLPMVNGTFQQDITLTHNDSGRFENRWVHLTTVPGTKCIWTKGLERLELPVRHGEGKFIPANADVMETMRDGGMLALRYCLHDGEAARGDYPANPNGSIDDIAGICDPTGLVFGLMPHPEGYTERTQHPRWTREKLPEEGLGLRIFRNAVEYCEGMRR